MFSNQLFKYRRLYQQSFKLKSQHEIPEFQITAKLYEHQSAAQLLHFEAQDKNQTFATIFRSEPTNSQGTPHILEHLICCGSEKYPVRDPFMAMIKRSINTYLNAWTGPDYICFPLASLNKKDFENLQNVILDLVFKPTLNELDFRQEGSRLDFEKGKLVYKGIVYNEMKGAMQNPESVFWQEMQTYLLNNSIYQHNFGGDPKAIPSLTHKALLDYYKQTFHPSKAIFYSYGIDQPNFDLINQYLQVQKLNYQQQSQQEIKPLTPPDIISLPYQDGDKQCFLAFQTIIKEADYVQQLALSIISHVLFDNQNGLLYSLIEEGLAESFSRNVGLEQYGENHVFSISFQGVEDDRKSLNKIQEKIKCILEQLTKEFPQDKVDAALHQIEVQFKMPTSEMGLKLLKFLINPIINQKNYIEYLEFNKNMANLKSKISQGYLQQLIKDHFLNPYVLFGQPDKKYLQNLIQNETKQLEEIQKTLTQEEIDKIIKLNKDLDNREESDFSILPTIELQDISAKVERVQFNEDVVRGVKVFETIQKTNGLTFFKFKFNLGEISEGTRQYIDFFVQLFGKFGTTNFTHSEISQMFSEFTLGLEVSYDSVQKKGTYLMFSIACLNQNVSKTLELLSELCCNVKFKDRSHLATLLRNHKVALQNQIFDEQLQYAAQLATSQISEQYYLTDTNFNTKFQLQYAHHYLKADNQRKSMYVDDFEFQMTDILYTIMNKHKLEVIIHQDGSSNYIQNLEQFINSIRHKYPGFDMDPQPQYIEQFNEKFGSVASLIPSQVNCSSRAFKIPYFTHEDTPAIQVLGDCISNSYLHREIREKGGAYGSGCSVRSIMGTFCLWSYRDPNLLNTFKIFDNIQLDLDEQKLKEAKLTVFQRLDQPIEPQNKGLDYIITGLNYEQVDEMRERVISVSLSQVRDAFDKYLKSQPYSQGSMVSEEHKDVEELKKLGWQINKLSID
ncbi:unnamed protein product [Paramecium octaurelia]|uniref:Peptidase M16C associated domain-containing protein n=1 Tax=Paramecium octaurelia TaxID=43137 RepID=A0A8S1THC9_PAROT|nr:unnamed protein product [Paramecium octaurelia]